MSLTFHAHPAELVLALLACLLHITEDNYSAHNIDEITNIIEYCKVNQRRMTIIMGCSVSIPYGCSPGSSR